MRVDLDSLYDETVTIVNRLDARDTPLRQDVYYAVTLTGCMWSQTQARTVQNDGTVVIGITHTVQVPENDRYMPYNEWCAAPKVPPAGEGPAEDPKEGPEVPEEGPGEGAGDAAAPAFEPPFTIRSGDHVFKGSVDAPKSASELKKMVSAHEPDVFQVQSFRDLTHGPGMEHSTEGIMRFAECYVLEG